MRKKYEEKRTKLGLTALWGREHERDVRLVQEHAVYAAMVEARDLAVGNRVELFHLAADLGEQTNLAAKEPQRAAQLRDDLHAWQKFVDAKLPIPNPNYEATNPSGRAAKRNPNP